VEQSVPETIDKLLACFDDETLARGRRELRSRNVVSIYWIDENTLVGRVTSSKKQVLRCEVRVTSDKSDVEDTDCACSEWVACRHAAAILLQYIENPDAVVLRPEATSNVQENVKQSTESLPRRPSISILEDLVGGFLNDDRAIRNPISSRPTKLNKISQSNIPQSNIPDEWTKLAPDLKVSLQSVADALSGSEKDGTTGGIIADEQRSRIIYVIGKDQLDWRCGHADFFEMLSVNVKKDGTFGAEREIGLFSAGRLPSAAGSEDSQIVQLASVMKFWDSAGWLNDDDNAEDLYRTSQNLLVTSVLATGRCKFNDKNGPVLQLGAELPGVLAWHKTEFERYRLELLSQGVDDSNSCLSWRFPWYLNRATNEIGPIKVDIPWSLLRPILRIRAITASESVALTCKLADFGLSKLIPPPPLDTQKVQVRLVKPKPQLVVTELTARSATGDNRKGKVTRALILAFPPDYITDKMREESHGLKIIEKQDKSLKIEFVDKIAQLGFRDVSETVEDAPSSDHFFLPQSPMSWAAFDRDVIKELRMTGIDVLQNTERALQPISINEKDIRINIKGDNRFWMTMELTIDVNGQRLPLLPILKSALSLLPSVTNESIETLNRNGRFSAAIEGGSIITMPFERIKTILLALQEILDQDSSGDFKASYLQVSELLKDSGLLNANWSGSEKIRQFVSQLSGLKNLQPVKAPRGFKAILRPYQEEGLSWLQFIASHNFGGILADDMGLGKTAQMLAHILLEKEQGRLKSPCLVVCPTSVLPNWSSEIEKFTPGLKKLIYAGGSRTDLIAAFQESDVVLTTYGLLLRDIDKIQQISWHGVVLDEAQAIKNPLAKVAEAARALKAHHKFCLTGTPVQNHLGELWSEFAFLMPGLLGEKNAFDKHIRTPIEKEGNTLRQMALAARIRPFLLRRTKGEVLADLPEKSVILKRIELDGQQRDLYETVRLSCEATIQSEIAAKGFKKSQLVILEALLKLRQVCCDPSLLKIESAKKVKGSAKLEALIEMIDQMAMEGRKMLVFSQFTSMLDLVAKELAARNIDFVELRGDTRDRSAPVRQFQETAVPVFLISLKAGGVGLNLTAADVVIHYDPWWNPAVEDQATDRAHRMGQEKHVFVYKLIANGTIEQWMLDIQERKRVLAASIYDEKGNLGAAFSEEDLAGLLKPLEKIDC
jgi:hypothetical protein